jgi:hypothetical protein
VIEYARGAEVGLDVPPEPPNFSVVLDANNFAWQRLAGTWVRGGTVLGFMGVNGTHQRWSDLLVDYGPVRVIHVPPAEETK